MKTIKWKLPFSHIDYLQSLTEDLADNPAVRLITGIQDSEGYITDCNITFKELDDITMEEVMLYTGAAIGAHSVDYALAIKEQKQKKAHEYINHIRTTKFDVCKMLDNILGTCIEEKQEVILLTQNAGDVVNENGEIVKQEEDIFEAAAEDVDFEEEEEVIVEAAAEVIVEEGKNPITKKQIEEAIIKTKDSKAKAMLRRVLRNFKKRIA